MHVLGINTTENKPTIFDIQDGRVLGARNSLDIASLKNYNSDWDYVACTDIHNLADTTALVKKFTGAKTIRTDYREALAMSSICTRTWETCAVMVVDSSYCGLGYYTGKQFYWLREFSYPNSLSLFYSAAARFLGFDPLVNEQLLSEAALHGLPTYENIIRDKVVSSTSGDYTLLLDLTRGVGTGPLNFDIAASVHTVFSSIILSLAQWLTKSVGSKQLAYAGRSSANYQTNTLLADFSGFDEIAIQPLTSSAGAALGAAALIHRPLWGTSQLGELEVSNTSPDDAATELQRGKILSLTEGRQEIADISLINRNRIAIPFDSLVARFKQESNFTYAWQAPIVLCQEQDYNRYYEGKQYPTYGQYLSKCKPGTPKFGTDYSRVVSTSITSNAYINRVLAITRANGYPLLISSPL
jgi:predicted NodU family carbamoyl transferase